MSNMYCFGQVSLLITHYNRSKSLENLLQAFKQQCIFGEIIVADDASNAEHYNKLRFLQDSYHFNLISSPKNKGLGNNINKGQDAVKLPFTLYVQEDFIPLPGFAPHLHDALQYMQDDKQLDIIRLYAYFPYPNLEPYKKGFFKMVFKNLTLNHLKFYYYSDHPHLRRSSFFNKFGRYAEGFNGDLTEYKMAISFLKNKGKGLFYHDFNTLFKQQNSLAEPSTMHRSNWRQNKSAAVLALRAVYLKFKFIKGQFDLWLSVNQYFF